MAKKLPTILSLGAALAALQGVSAVNSTAAVSFPGSGETNATQIGRVATGEPNVFMSVGNDLLGLIVTTKADGTVVADHYSHSSLVAFLAFFSLFEPITDDRSARHNCRVRSVAVDRGTARSCVSADWGGVLPHRHGRRPTLVSLDPEESPGRRGG
jgi:hypothetical protein